MGIPQLDVGIRTDIMETCPKDLGIMMVLRSMSPDVIVTDEIGNESEIKALYTALKWRCKLNYNSTWGFYRRYTK